MNELAIKFDAESGKHLYEQIYEYIRDETKEGKLLPGEKLPSTRFLAEYLNVSRSTVELAYEQLLSEGYIEARPYRGYYVCPVEGLASIPMQTLTQTGASGERDNQTAETDKRSYRFDFSPYRIEMNAFPFDTWRRISRTIMTEGQSDLFALGSPQGDLELRETICRYLHSSRGVNCAPEQIVVGAGNDYLLMLLEKLLGRDVRLAMENPTYIKAYRIFESFGYQITAVPMDAYGMRVDVLRHKDVRVVYVMPSHQFPTGTVMPIGRRLELLHWAGEEEGRYLIEDDYDSEFRYRGKPIPALQATDQSGKVIYIGTFSKSIAPAIRISYMVLPEKLLSRYRTQGMLYASTVSRIDQRILNEFIRDGYFERHLNRMRKLYRMRHDRMLEELKGRGLEKDFKISGENAGLHLLLKDKRGRSEEELVRSAAGAGVRVYGMGEYLVERPEDRPATLLLGYATLQESEIAEAVAVLRECYK